MPSNISSIAPDNSTDAAFRVWAKYISDQLAAMGLTKTVQTGEINLATVTRPLAINTSQGFQIWAFADALQGSAPVYFKIEYGSGAATDRPAIWITVGTANDGAGAITGLQQLARRQIAILTAGSATQRLCLVAGNTNWIVVAMFWDLASMPFLFAIERSHDGTGADTGTAILFATITSLASSSFSQVCPAAGSIPTAETRWSAILSTNNPAAYDSKVSVGFVVPFLGVALNPFRSLGVYNSNDFGEQMRPICTLYGSNQTMFTLTSFFSTNPIGISSVGKVMVRLS